MGDVTTRQQVVEELYNRYLANGFITENEALACFVAHNTSLSGIDSLTDQLLTLGVIIKLDDESGDEESTFDRSKLDYNEICDEILEIEPGLVSFIEYVRAITPPQNREVQNLIPQVRIGNQYARTRLIEMYLRTVIKQALYYSKRYFLPLEDTIQDGIIGFLIAIDKFDPAEHEKFSTYAPWWVGQSITRRRHFPGNPMYFPVYTKERLFLIQEKVIQHGCKDCWDNDNTICPVLINEICKEYGWSDEDARTFIFHHKQWQYIEDIGAESKEFSDNNLFSDWLVELAESITTAKTLTVLMEMLKERERAVIKLRNGFVADKVFTLDEIGRDIGLTRERVRQIESKALQKLRKQMELKIGIKIEIDKNDK